MFDTNEELIARALTLWANYVETGDLATCAKDVERSGEGKIKALDEEQMMLVVRMRMLSRQVGSGERALLRTGQKSFTPTVVAALQELYSSFEISDTTAEKAKHDIIRDCPDVSRALSRARKVLEECEKAQEKDKELKR